MNTIFARGQRFEASRFVTILILAFAWVGSADAQKFTQRTNLLSDSNFHSGVAMGVADMNGDGLDDIIRLNNARSLSIEYQGAANAAFSNFNYGSLAGGSEWSLCVGDVDGNGYNDLVVGGAYNNCLLYTSPSPRD